MNWPLRRDLSLSSTFVVRFQQSGSHDFSGGSTDGIYIDDVQVLGQAIANNPKIISFTPQQGIPGTEVTIEG